MPGSLVEQFERLRDSGSVDVFSFLLSQHQLSTHDQVQVLLIDQQNRWMAGQPLKVEDYLIQLPEIASDLSAVLELTFAEFTARFSSGNTPDVEEFADRFPRIADSLRKRIRNQQSPSPVNGMGISTETMIPAEVRAALLNGRYRKVRELGTGAFGQVYLAFDEDLQRQVAIKIPTAERFQRARDADLFLSEARTVANLSHPHIVPVYDMGRTPEGAVFVVSRFIEGGTLKERLQSSQMSPEDSARLLKTIAAALHYAHQRRLIHRDVKPDNILIEASTNTPFVADFGLAIREEDYAKQLGIAGTPAYMSPEQARGEGHRLDCRCDVFSLGVILYELLTGQRPFRGSTPNEVMYQVVSIDPVSPCSVRENVPSELERICLKAMSKQASDRYHSAAELVDDLEAWLSPKSPSSAVTSADVAVVPKGLRSFDAGDADFFLDLLPGPRNRQGLPESISFWKQRLEQTDSELTFAVGLIYGPSGCGKSSLVKAGLLPHLSDDLIAVFVEATPDETEQRILRGLRKRQPNLPTELGLIDTLATLRRGTAPKVVIIIDQFEQWLHTHRADAESELVQALRHCDGGHLQAVVMIRDDFAMAAARFMDALDIPILQGVNFATVDLFDVRHAAKVLTKFGRAFQQLPSGNQALTEEQERFVSAVAEGLAQDGKVVSVRLALFAEMIKNKRWTQNTLQDVGGTEGIGVNFLEETFGSRTANPQHRQHQAAARIVLKALLPEVGTDIKGHMRSHKELLDVLGYSRTETEASSMASAPGPGSERVPVLTTSDSLIGSDFNELLRILDGELRLITPTDPGGHTSQSDNNLKTQYYQLTHDYLVPSLRDWLTLKQKESRTGRAQLKLSERASVWRVKPENRHLPTFVESCQIFTLTSRHRWSETEKQMMNAVFRRNLTFLSAILIAVVGLTVGSYEIQKKTKQDNAEQFVQRLLDIDSRNVFEVLKHTEPLDSVTRQCLDNALRQTPATDNGHWNIQLALLPVEPEHANSLVSQILKLDPLEASLYIEYLAGQRVTNIEPLLDVLDESSTVPAETLLRATAAILRIAPARLDLRSGSLNKQVFDALLVLDPDLLEGYLSALSEMRSSILHSAVESYCYPAPDASADTAHVRRLETMVRIISRYEMANPELLARAIICGPDQFFRRLFESCDFPEKLKPHLNEMADSECSGNDHSHPDIPDHECRRRKTLAAVALARLGSPEMLCRILQQSADNTERFFVVTQGERLGLSIEFGAGLLRQSPPDHEPFMTSESIQDPNLSLLRSALLLVGNYDFEVLREPSGKDVEECVQSLFLHHPDAGVHAAAEWVLTRWREHSSTAADHQSSAEDLSRSWYTNSNGHKMVRIAGQTTIVMGTPLSEIGRDKEEHLHTRRINHSFCVSMKETTIEQCQLFFREEPRYWRPYPEQHAADAAQTAQLSVSWFCAAGYCNWLSRREGLPECYTPNGEAIIDDGVSVEEARFHGGGYRLPTEAEWEYVCRAGTTTRYHFGSDEELLSHFGWGMYNANDQAHECGLKMPNDIGLFDIHGNLWEWCQDSISGYAADGSDLPEPSTLFGIVHNNSAKIMRGGAFVSQPRYLRSAFRDNKTAEQWSGLFGFRIARTIESSIGSSDPGTRSE